MTLAPQTTGRPTAPIRRWDPFREMGDVYDRMTQLVQGFLVDGMPSAIADVEETDDAYIVDIDLPAVKPEDINLEIRDNMLRITGEIKERQRTGILRRKGRRVGQFEHMVALPGDVDPSKVDATLANGVLTVRVGKTAASQPRKIEVKSNG
jgi:HSP20 family protein